MVHSSYHTHLHPWLPPPFATSYSDNFIQKLQFYTSKLLAVLFHLWYKFCRALWLQREMHKTGINCLQWCQRWLWLDTTKFADEKTWKCRVRKNWAPRTSGSLLLISAGAYGTSATTICLNCRPSNCIVHNVGARFWQRKGMWGKKTLLWV